MFQADALSNVTRYAYDVNNNKISQTVTRTRSDGTTETLITRYEYDANNRLIKATNPDGTFTQTTYNAIGKPDTTIDARGNQTKYAYDDDGRTSQVTYADQSVDTFAYDNEGHRTTQSPHNAPSTSYSYDELGRVKETFFAGSHSFTTYDALGRVKSSTDARNNITNYAYDDAGRRSQVTDALGKITTFEYDEAGNMTAMTDARHNKTQYVYDDAGRRTQTIFPDLTTETVKYDELGRQIAKTDQAGKITQFAYDALGRLSTVTQFLNNVPLITRYTYDELGNRITQTDANGHTTRFAYDQLGRRASRTLPVGMSESYSYDPGSNLSARTDFNGHTTTYAYDNMNRLRSKTADAFFSTGACAPGSGGTPACGATQVSFTYNNHGKRNTMTDALGVTTYDYDVQDHLAAKSTPIGDVSWTYDLAGNLTRHGGSTGLSVTYTYDALNRLQTMSTSFAELVTYNYDDVGNLKGTQVGGLFSTGYTYDPLNRLTNMQSTCGTGAPGCGVANTPVRSYAYTLGAAGNRLSVAELSGRTVNYGYDDLYRLTSETISGATAQNGTVGYQYDSVGNRVQLSSTLPTVPASGLLNYDANDRTSTDVYDANGNTTFNGQQNVYDFENHLVKRGGVTIVYDGDGNRVMETVAGVTTKYLVGEVNPTGYVQVFAELNGTNGLLRAYEWGLQLEAVRDFTVNSFGIFHYYGHDGHGSVRYLTDANGAVTDTYDYDAFGNLISSTGTTFNSYLFAGEQFDPALGIYYNRARYYDQRQGRFWSMDAWEGGSSQDPESLHRFLYASANPVNRVDPSGLASIAEETEANAINQTVETKADVQPVNFFRRAFLNKTWDVYIGIHPMKSFPFVHSFIYTNRKGANTGVKWDIGVYYNESPFSWATDLFAPDGYLVPRPTSLGAMERLVAFNGGVLFKFASFNNKQEILWTALVIPIGFSAKLNEEIRIPYSIIPIPGLNSCLKWTFEAAVAALTVQFVPL